MTLKQRDLAELIRASGAAAMIGGQTYRLDTAAGARFFPARGANRAREVAAEIMAAEALPRDDWTLWTTRDDGRPGECLARFRRHPAEERAAAPVKIH